jgi:hypothetical protein
MRPRKSHSTRLVAAVACSLTALAGCWDEDGGGAARPRPRGATAETVIRAWADTLRRGDVKRAASYFAVPAVVENGTPPLRLGTRAAVRAFNRGLPCGARLLRTYALGRYTAAVFSLTERPGRGRCGSGAGRHASTAFLVRDGKIREWRRLPDRPERPPSSAPIV